MPAASAPSAASKSVAFVTHPDCLKHDMGAHHPERPQRLTAVEGSEAAASFSVAVGNVHSMASTATSFCSHMGDELLLPHGGRPHQVLRGQLRRELLGYSLRVIAHAWRAAVMIAWCRPQHTRAQCHVEILLR